MKERNKDFINYPILVVCWEPNADSTVASANSGLKDRALSATASVIISMNLASFLPRLL